MPTPSSSSDLNAVPLGVGHEPDLIDRAEIARGDLEADELVQLGNPDAAPLDVHILPPWRLDVRVRHVASAHTALPGNLTSSHEGGVCSLAGHALQRAAVILAPIRQKTGWSLKCSYPAVPVVR